MQQHVYQQILDKLAFLCLLQNYAAETNVPAE